MRIVIPHSFRRMTLECKEKILINSLKIPEAELKRIRSIDDVKNRFIESAKLQWEMFKDIHGDVTAWLAGFSSESSVRRVFGSHFNLRNELGLLPKSNWKSVLFSQEDLRRRIKIPEEITPEVAEETGIHIGDGSLWLSGSEGKSFCFAVSGNLREEIIFFEEFISKLHKGIFNINPRIKKIPEKNECKILIKSKAIFTFKTNVMGLPWGEKCHIVRIPKEIIEDKELSKNCLRGIFDTDGSVSFRNEVCLEIVSASKGLLKDLKNILKNLHFSFSFFHKRNEIKLNKESTLKFLEEINLHNIKHWSKFLLWKEFGFCPTFTHTEERLAILKDKLNFENLLKISEKRRKKARPGRD